jgi:hypothetical protein
MRRYESLQNLLTWSEIRLEKYSETINTIINNVTLYFLDILSN